LKNLDLFLKEYIHGAQIAFATLLKVISYSKVVMTGD